MTKREEMIYDTVVEFGIATKEEINLVRNIVSGTWEDVLNDIIFARTGYHTLEQFIDCEIGEDDEESDSDGISIFSPEEEREINKFFDYLDGLFN